jgi:hypothetical protein
LTKNLSVKSPEKSVPRAIKNMINTKMERTKKLIGLVLLKKLAIIMIFFKFAF